MKKYPSKASLILRMAAAVYLMYLAYSLKDSPANYTGIESILYVAAIVIFVTVAVALGVMSLKAYVKGEYEGAKAQDDEKIS